MNSTPFEILDGRVCAPSAFQRAARFAEEYQLGLWVRAKNLAGASVPTQRLIVEFQANLQSQPPWLPQVS